MQSKKNESPAPTKNEQRHTACLPEVYKFGHSNQPVHVEIINNEPWFVAKDICDCLKIGNVTESLRNLDGDEKMPSVVLRAGKKVEVNLVNESGLYNLIFQSRKPEARAFRKWVTSEVLPSIRKTGKYLMPPAGNRIVQIASNISMNVIPSERHEFLVTTKEFARAINISENTIRTNKSRGNFKEDIHFIDNYDVYDDDEKLEVRCTVWTKKGVIEHATFIRTGYGKELRNWVGNQNGSALVVAGKPIKRNHNRLTHERLLDIMSDVCEIENKELRLRISTKLTGGV